MRALRTTVTAMLPLLLGGCALSPLFVATSAGDNATYSGTGKSMADYALSELVGRDCTVMFGFTRGQFCKDKPKASPAAAQPSTGAETVDDADDGTDDAIFAMTEATSADVAPTAPGQGAAPPTATASAAGADHSSDDGTIAEDEMDPADAAKETSAAAAQGAVPVQGEPLWTFVLGTFEQYEQAVALAKKLKPKPAVVSSIIVHGEVLYRVTTRPFTLDTAAENERQVAAIGFPDVSMVAVCPRWMQDGTCVVLDRHLPL